MFAVTITEVTLSFYKEAEPIKLQTLVQKEEFPADIRVLCNTSFSNKPQFCLALGDNSVVLSTNTAERDTQLTLLLYWRTVSVT